MKLTEMTAQFEEFYLRVGVLKTNPHIRNFIEKVQELERVIKTVVDLLGEWFIF
jgi:hypothetical protein